MVVDEGVDHNIPWVKHFSLECHEEPWGGSVHLEAAYRLDLNGRVERQRVQLGSYWFHKAPAGG